MQVILLQNIKSLGKAGDIKEVSDGYARNFLLPRSLVKIATETAIQRNTEQKIKQFQIEQVTQEKISGLAKRLQDQEIYIKSKGTDGKLFGSINKKMIIEELKQQNFIIPEKYLVLASPIKKTGDVKIEVNFGQGIKTHFVLKVLAE